MEKISDLRAKRAEKVDALVKRMNADGYVEVDADQKAYDDLKKEIDGFDKRIERSQEANRLNATLAKPEKTDDQPGQRRTILHARPRTSRLKKLQGRRCGGTRSPLRPVRAGCAVGQRQGLRLVQGERYHGLGL